MIVVLLVNKNIPLFQWNTKPECFLLISVTNCGLKINKNIFVLELTIYKKKYVTYTTELHYWNEN